jgi:hypothetical protein
MDINVLAFISNNKPKMLKVGPKRQVFGALIPSVKVGLTIQAEPTNDGGNWGATGGRDSPFREAHSS